MEIKDVKYEVSVTQSKFLINDNLPQFAFVGRSNVGKSSLINFITGHKSIAKTSSTPGKTKMINYFLINNSFRFVDLPGYGYSKTGKVHQDIWADLIGDYLLKTKNLLNVFLLLDIRHSPSQLDRQMIDFLLYNNLPYNIILTKADKLPKSKIIVAVEKMAKTLNLRKEIFIVTSSMNNIGRDKLLELIEWKLEEFLT